MGIEATSLRDWLLLPPALLGASPSRSSFGEDGTPHLLPWIPHCRSTYLTCADYELRTFDPMDAESNLEAPLSRNEDRVKVELDLGDGKKTNHHRDTNTMPNWAGSPAGTTCALHRPDRHQAHGGRRTSSTTGWARTTTSTSGDEGEVWTRTSWRQSRCAPPALLPLL